MLSSVYRLQLDTLCGLIPGMKAKHTVGGVLQDEAFWIEFHGNADAILSRMVGDDLDVAVRFIRNQLLEAGLDPSRYTPKS